MNPTMPQNFISVALPIMITFVAMVWIVAWSHDKPLADFVASSGALRHSSTIISRHHGAQGAHVAPS